jgi:hypothetical protein
MIFGFFVHLIKSYPQIKFEYLITFLGLASMYLFAYIARKTPSLVGRGTKSLILFNRYETYQFFFNKIITPIVVDFCLLWGKFRRFTT